MSERWPIRHYSAEEVRDVEVIHARASSEDDYTLCEQGGGPHLPFGTVARNLDVPMEEGEPELPVNCPSCLEWMHA